MCINFYLACAQVCFAELQGYVHALPTHELVSPCDMSSFAGVIQHMHDDRHPYGLNLMRNKANVQIDQDYI